MGLENLEVVPYSCKTRRTTPTLTYKLKEGSGHEAEVAALLSTTPPRFGRDDKGVNVSLDQMRVTWKTGSMWLPLVH